MQTPSTYMEILSKYCFSFTVKLFEVKGNIRTLKQLLISNRRKAVMTSWKEYFETELNIKSLFKSMRCSNSKKLISPGTTPVSHDIYLALAVFCPLAMIRRITKKFKCNSSYAVYVITRYSKILCAIAAILLYLWFCITAFWFVAF